MTTTPKPIAGREAPIPKWDISPAEKRVLLAARAWHEDPDIRGGERVLSEAVEAWLNPFPKPAAGEVEPVAQTLPRGVEVCPDCGRAFGGDVSQCMRRMAHGLEQRRYSFNDCMHFTLARLRSELSTLREQLAERHGVWEACCNAAVDRASRLRWADDRKIVASVVAGVREENPYPPPEAPALPAGKEKP